jgi:uncharacterized protein (DUF302 family)
MLNDMNAERKMTDNLGFEVQLDRSYEQAIEDVTEALKTEGFGILTKIDVKATLKEKLDKDFRPYAILGACNPLLAHRALSHKPEVGLVLPCNVTVEAIDTNGSLVRIGDPDVFMQIGGLNRDPEIEELGREVRQRILRVVNVLKEQ